MSAKSPPASWNAAMKRHSATESGANGASTVRGEPRSCIRAADGSTLTVSGWPKRKSRSYCKSSASHLVGQKGGGSRAQQVQIGFSFRGASRRQLGARDVRAAGGIARQEAGSTWRVPLHIGIVTTPVGCDPTCAKVSMPRRRRRDAACRPDDGRRAPRIVLQPGSLSGPGVDRAVRAEPVRIH